MFFFLTTPRSYTRRRTFLPNLKDSASSPFNEVKTYIDGKVTHETKGDGKLSDNWGLQAEIGHHKNDRWFDGLMDEFYIFSRALSEDEIKEVMDGEFLSVEPADKLATTWGSLKSRR